jgi:hypothetical protein
LRSEPFGYERNRDLSTTDPLELLSVALGAAAVSNQTKTDAERKHAKQAEPTGSFHTRKTPQHNSRLRGSFFM